MVLSSIPHSSSQIDARLKLYLIEMPRRVVFVDVDRNHIMDNGVDNPFRPGSELSKEADIIVNLIKEGKPITPTKETVDSPSNGLNGINGKKEMNLLEKSPELNGTPKNKVANTVVEVQHGIVVPPNDSKQLVEEINLKKRRKCCTIQ
jgi:hypothetical protein